MLKFAKNLLTRTAQKEPPYPTPDTPLEIFEEPEMMIGPSVTINGRIAFQREIHIDGVFEGELEGNGRVVIGPEGFVKADLNLQEAEIAGKVEGNITVKGRLILRDRAEVRGNITASCISVDEGVSIIGQLHVTAIEEPTEDL